MNNNTYESEVLAFATKAHEGQFRKYADKDTAPVPYITHPIAVAENVLANISDGQWKALFGGRVSSVAYLHDVLEDTDVEEKQLLEFLQSLDAKYAVNWSGGILTSVKALTKPRLINGNLLKYLDVIKNDVIALHVKQADLRHNMSDLKDLFKLDYYRLVEHYLTH